MFGGQTSHMSTSHSHRIVTTKQYERTVAQRVSEQTAHDSIQAHSKENNRLLASNMSDDRIETLRKLKYLQHANAELAAVHSQQIRQHEQEQRQKLYEQDKVLVETVAKLKQERLSEESKRKSVIESNAELAALRAQLRHAEINMIRSRQMSERKLLEQSIREKELEIDAELERDRQIAVQLEQEYQVQSQRDSRINRDVLTQQINERVQKQQEQYQMFLAEKQLVDEVVASIAAEDAVKAQKAEQQRAELQRSIQQYLHSRAAWRDGEKQRLEAEMYEIEKYQLLQQQRQNELLQAKKEKFAAHDAVLERLTAEINAKRKQQEEYQALLDELYQEEMEQRQLADVRARENKLLQQQRDMAIANAAQRAAKADQQAREAADEAEFRRQMLEKFSRDTRIEQMNAERRRREMIEYKKEVESLIESKRQSRQHQVDTEVIEQQKQAEKNAAELKIVEAERKRLLDEYASKLQNHLPKGVFRSADEYERVTGKQATQRLDDAIPVVRASNGPRAYIK